MINLIQAMMGRVFVILLILFEVGQLFAQTIAHDKSRFAVIDPCYKTDKLWPESGLKTEGALWIYGPSELECWRLQLLRDRKDSAKLKVGYPGTYHQNYTNASFRLRLNEMKGATTLKFRAVGKGEAYLNAKEILHFDASDVYKSISIPLNVKASELRFELSTSAEPPALLIDDGIFSTNNNYWEWKAEGENWQPAFHFAQTNSGIPPHQFEYSEVNLKPETKDGKLYDFGRELFGYIVIKNKIKPNISVGESKDEALDISNKEQEQSLEMNSVGGGLWRSKSLLAFRYLYTDAEKAEDINCDAVFYPVCYKGAFACSDSILTRTWMTSAYTLRLCLHDFLIDGIKRDRLPWTGDMAMSMMADAYSFGDPEIVRRSLAVLGRSGIDKTDINGIIDYSLWWIIAQDNYQLYFGDKKHLKHEWPLIKKTLNRLSSRCDASGFLNTEKTWLFIDWVDQEKWTALQILWWWAQECGIKLANREGDTQTAKHLQDTSNALKVNLLKTSWSPNKGVWLGNPEFPERMSRHANLLAVISGLATKDQYEGIQKLLSDDKISLVGTPYMAGFENIALSRLGDIQLMIDHVKDYWGGMLKQGATTFWEAYDPKQKGKEMYVFYDRPYGKSLCHAWSAGPAAFLPSEILGLRPIEDGWRRFSVKPNLGLLNWISATVPTPFGIISVDIEGKNMTLNIPKGTVAEWNGKSISGPKRITEKLLP
jgi:alpha-L-rhamnosidase